MPIITYGINHKSAPLDIRERVAVSPEQTTDVLRHLRQQTAVNEAVLISTCNRTEIVTITEHQASVEQWLLQDHANDLDVSPYCFGYRGIDAVRHLMRVASGLDSMVLGEPQILGQIKQAYSAALNGGFTGKQLNHLFPAIFSASKIIRSETDIGKSPISFAYTIVQLAKQIFANIADCRVLLIGAGETIELVATHLHHCGVSNMVVANRTVERGEDIAKQFDAHAIRIGDIPAYLPEADIVVTATASQLPIIGKGMIEQTIKQKKHRPILMVDLAVPRDIEPQVAELEDVYLYNLDALQSMINKNLENREEAAKQAEAMVDIQAEHYMRQLQVFNAGHLIRDYRGHQENICHNELQKARKQLQQGESPDVVLENFARNLTNKMLHRPSTVLRQAAYEERMDILLAAKELFEL